MSPLALFSLLVLRFAANPWPVAAHRQVPAIYVFGDSTADVGNNNHFPGYFQANFRPYGVDYPGSIPTGRFCNGYVGVDFIAQRLGFEKSPPAALSVATAAKESRGVNYASAGSGVLDLTGRNKSLSMNTQIRLFKKTVRRLVRARGEPHANQFLSRSLFIFSTFNNDLFALVRDDPTAATNETLQDRYISSLTRQFGKQLQRLYKLGARRMIVSGTGRLGCPPLLRISSPTGDCLEALNAISRRFNVAMKKKMGALSSELKGLRYSYLNSYAIYAEILRRAKEFGFTELKSACCGSGFLECNPNSTYCSNRDTYLSWDSVHPTQASYRRTIDIAYSGLPGIVEPFNLDELVRHH